jgi:hypothetical protein
MSIEQEIEDFVYELSRRFKIGPSTCVATTVAGERYVELISVQNQQIFFEAQERLDKYRTLDTAWEALKRSFEMYAEGRTGTLYWRLTPEVNECQEIDYDSLSPTFGQTLGPKYYLGYMRLFIAET